MKTKNNLFLIAITINVLISCTSNATPPINVNASPTLPPRPTSTQTPQPTLSPTPEPTATSAYYYSLSTDQQTLYDSAPNMDDKGWDKRFLSKPFENYVGYYNVDEVVAIFEPKSEKVFNALLVNNNLFVNEGRSAIAYNPVFSKDEARTIVDNVMLWYRIRLCATQKRVILPSDLEEVVSSTKFQDYLDNCTITLRSWTAEKTHSQARNEGCAPYYYSVPQQTMVISRDSGIIIWLNSKRLKNTVNICLAKFDRESIPPKVLGYYLGFAVGIDQVPGSPIEISVYASINGGNNLKYVLACSLREALSLTSMRVYKAKESYYVGQMDDNFYEIMDHWTISCMDYRAEPPLIYDGK